MQLDAPWEVIWASTTDDDPRIVRRWQTGPVQTSAIDTSTALIAVGSGSGIQVRNIDNENLWTAPGEPLCLEFAGRILLSGHTDGFRIWDATDGTPIGEVSGIGQVHQIVVVDAAEGPQMVTRNGRNRVQRWSLPSGRPIGGPELPDGHTITAGRLGDGRLVLLAGLDGLALHDLDSHERSRLVGPPSIDGIRSVALGTATGRDLVSAVDQSGGIHTFDVRTGAAVGEVIPTPAGRPEQGRRQRIAVVGGVLAVSDRWRVRLYEQATSAPVGPPLAGPVAASTMAASGTYLLTSSKEDRSVVLWDPTRPTSREPGHDARIIGITRARADVVVSADAAGTLLARDTADGRLLHPPTRTAVVNTRALTAWTDGPAIVAATGAGEPDRRDPLVRLLDLTTGQQYHPPIDTGQRLVRRLAVVGPLLITGDGRVRTWRTCDGAPQDEWTPPAGPAPSGFGVGTRYGRDVVVTCVTGERFRIHDAGDLGIGPTVIPAREDDVVLTVSGPYIVTRGRVLDTSGHTVRAGIRRLTDATLATVRAWPQVYLAHEDGTISLTDLLTGEDLTPPMTLPSMPISIAATTDGDLLVGYGSDTARLSPRVL
ncbi:WD40 repeat domain-containing protein [Actinoplanes sp. NBRC 101535]|uniref:WD40 repeat domain-containing protein n=1 Tax=Actinoplanes sp. NBRC 101535 TaxID=3032196 RepID=UPI0024A535C0|nr:WD40 repeat domain-containing protein [Actinoplanes sp. NBRC 101535]GLY05027.1 hypothetical protein Acsp01_54060 [Actinoplanes sp. NBRC 101535]